MIKLLISSSGKSTLVVLAILLLSSMHTFVWSQPTWSENVASIVYNNCTKCHNTNGVAPFPLQSFQHAYQKRLDIKAAVISKVMPPWPPDPAYSHFAKERVLSTADIQTITNWVNAGAPQGNPANEPAAPTFPAGTQIANPDLVLKIPTYTHSAAVDVYRCFAIPSNLVGDRFISEIEVVPGNRKIVHHVLAFQDVSNTPLQLDAQDPLPGYTNYGGTGSSTSNLITGWVPGQGVIKYPTGMGIKLRAQTNLVLQVHYPGVSASQKDSTEIVIKFAPQGAALRNVFTVPALFHEAPVLQNGPLLIPANQTKTFYTRLPVPSNMSIISIAPHMHLIGRRAKAYAILPGGDTLRLINIPDWDFNWQGGYDFRKVTKIPAGSVLVGECFYDNTSNNPFNPSNPPIMVKKGENTTDEMLLFYFTYLDYEQGDENIVIDSTAIINAAFNPIYKSKLNVQCFPNPAKQVLNIQFTLKEKDIFSLDIVCADGTSMKGLQKGEWLEKGKNHIQIPIADLKPGLYYLRMQAEKVYAYQKFVKL